MKTSLLALSALLGLTSASALPEYVHDSHVESAHSKRASFDAPDGYAPGEVDCPAKRPVIRSGTSISPWEKEWLQKRQQQIVNPMKDFLGRMNIADFDSSGFIDELVRNGQALPNIAIAVAGGSYRAMLNGAGVLAAFDSRVEEANSPGGLGGLLQSSTQLSGVSGSSWLVGTLYTNNFPSTQDVITGKDSFEGGLWNLQNNILQGPPEGFGPITLAKYLLDVGKTVKAKSDAGYPVTLTDIWSRMLAYQFVSPRDGGEQNTWSSIAANEAFVTAQIPMPFVLAIGRTPEQDNATMTPTTSTIFEYTPWELGSYDENLAAFAPLQYVGSKFEAGELPADESCVVGFDNSGFVIGTSSSLFDQFIQRLNGKSNVPALLKHVLTDVLEHVGEADYDVAAYEPNPFRGFQQEQQTTIPNPWADTDRLMLVDGGEDGRVIPFHPHLHPERATDVIFAIDSAADTRAPGFSNWPNGASMVATYERAQLDASGNSPFGSAGALFPPVPDVNTFVNLGLNNRPAFFGCDAANMTAGIPLVVYLPSSPYNFFANVSSGKLSFSTGEQAAFFTNGYNFATQANGTRPLPSGDGVASDWPTCVACAVLSRSFDRAGAEVPQVCKDCFEEYCWDGTLDTRELGPYDPQPVLPLWDVDDGDD